MVPLNCKVVNDNTTGTYLYVKWKNIEASADRATLRARYHDNSKYEHDVTTLVGPFVLSFPNPTFVGGSTKNIPCHSNSPVTISLNPYNNTDDNGIDKDLEITSNFRWTLPSGWQTISGKTGTFDASYSISVIPPLSSTSTVIDVQPFANSSQSIQYGPEVSLQITRNLDNFAFAGPDAVIYNTAYRYEVPSMLGVSYTWQLPNGWTGSSTTNYIDVIPGCSGGTVSVIVNGCNQSVTKSKSVTVNKIDTATVISGPDAVCFSGTTFQIFPAPPAGTTITWNSSSNLTKTAQSGYSATFNANYAGSGWIEATLNVPACNYSITLPPKSTWMSNYYFHITRPDGQPVTTDEYGNTSFCSYTDYEISLWPNDYIPCYTHDHDWEIPSTWTTNYINGSTISVNTGDDPYNFIAVEFRSCCNDEDIYHSQYFEYSTSCSQYQMVFTPNPATNETTLILTSKSTTQLGQTDWEFEVYDTSQVLKDKKSKLKEPKQVINTSNWKDGLYIVKAKIGKETVTGKLVIKH